MLRSVCVPLLCDEALDISHLTRLAQILLRLPEPFQWPAFRCCSCWTGCFIDRRPRSWKMSLFYGPVRLPSNHLAGVKRPVNYSLGRLNLNKGQGSISKPRVTDSLPRQSKIKSTYKCRCCCKIPCLQIFPPGSLAYLTLIPQQKKKKDAVSRCPPFHSRPCSRNKALGNA